MKKKWTTYVVFFSIIVNFFVSSIISDYVKASANDEITKDIQSTVLDAIIEHKEEVNVSGYKIEAKKMVDVFNKVYFQNPQYVGVSLPQYSYYLRDGKKIVTSIKLSYEYTKEKMQNMIRQMEQERRKIISGINDKMTQAQIALYVHDYLVLNCEYNYDVYKGKEGNKSDYTAYGVMIKRKGVCMGYSLAYNYIMNDPSIGIDTTMVTSEKMNHAWNLVKIDGKYYHIDISWDDKLSDTLGYSAHENFLLSDTGIKNTAHYSWSAKAEASEKKYDNYFWKDVISAFVYVSNKCYYFDNKDLMIKEYSFDNNKSTEIYKVTDTKSSIGKKNMLDNLTWYEYNNVKSYYTKKYVYLAAKDNCLYFNTNSQIYQLDPNTKKAVKVYNVSDNEVGENKGWLYGIAFNGNKLYYQVKEGMGSKYLGRNKQVPNVTVSDTVSNDTNQTNDIQNANIMLSQNVYVYNDTQCKPSVTVCLNGNILSNNTDYTISYVSNTNVGKGYVQVNGKGKYVGEKKVYFNIYMPVVKNVCATKNSTDSISLKWDKLKGVSGYEIYRRGNSEEKYSLVGRTNDVSYLDKNIKLKDTCMYKVRAYCRKDDKAIFGEYSTPIVAYTTGVRVDGVAISSPTTKTIKYTWKRFEYSSGYEVQRSLNKTKNFVTIIKTSNSNTIGINNKNLTKKKVYYYRMRSYNKVKGYILYTGWSTIKGIRCS